MNSFFTSGRIIWAVSLISLGLIHLICSNFPVSLLPISAHFPGRSILVISMGLGLVSAGLCIGLSWKADRIAFGLGILFGILALLLHVPTLVANPHNGNAWTVLGELLAFSGGAFYGAGLLARALETDLPYSYIVLGIGRWLFVIALVIFGILHFNYADYIATLIPSWIPTPLFWAYFVGVAFLATALSLLIRRQVTLSTRLLGLMFLIWVLILHLPRAVNKPHSEPEWTSLVVALTMSGFCLMIAGVKQRIPVRVDVLAT